MLQQDKINQTDLSVKTSLDLINRKQLTSFIANLRRNSENKTTKDELVEALNLTVNQTFGPEKNIDPGTFIRTLSLISQNIKITENRNEDKIINKWLLSFAALSIDEITDVISSPEFASVLNDAKFMDKFGIKSRDRAACNTWYGMLSSHLTFEEIISYGSFREIQTCRLLPAIEVPAPNEKLLNKIKEIIGAAYSFSKALSKQVKEEFVSLSKSRLYLNQINFLPILIKIPFSYGLLGYPILNLAADKVLVKMAVSFFLPLFTIYLPILLSMLSVVFSPTIFAITCIACDLIAVGVRSYNLIKGKFTRFNDNKFVEPKLVSNINKIDFLHSILASNTVCALFNIGIIQTLLINIIPDIICTLFYSVKLSRPLQPYAFNAAHGEISETSKNRHYLLLEKIISSNEQINAEEMIDKICGQIVGFGTKSRGEQDSIRSILLSELFSTKIENGIHTPTNDNFRNFLNREVNENNNELYIPANDNLRNLINRGINENNELQEMPAR